jgi:hypothetical protein
MGMKSRALIFLSTVFVFICLLPALGMSFGVPEAPTIISSPRTGALEGNLYTYNVEAIVKAGDPTPVYRLITCPKAMTIDPVSGLIQWFAESVGDFDVSVEAANLAGRDIQSFTLRVRERRQPTPLFKCALVDMDNQDGSQMARIHQEKPTAFALLQNHPNPFNPETEISYTLSKDTYVNLTVYNILGQKVKTLVDGFETAGPKSVIWEGTDEGGNQIGSGVYFYRISAGGFVQTNRMIMLR